MPKDLLPSFDKGNYSLVLFNENKNKVNDWMKNDLRNRNIALNIIKRDLKKFEDYNYFDLSEINSIKFRNQIEDVVNEKYNHPTEINVGGSAEKSFIYPEKFQLAEEYKGLVE
jgi:hypothetical protein